VRSTDARRRERDTPEGVVHGFQVSLYKVEPRPDIAARNLLSIDDWRPALLDEPVEGWPEVPLVSKPSSFACRAERLARTGTGPNRSVVCPASTAESQAPDADAGEEMALGELAQVCGAHVLDAAGVDDAIGDVAGGDEVAEPTGCIVVNLVVVGGHGWGVPFSRMGFRASQASCRRRSARR
jgi:hypothetical protein